MPSQLQQADACDKENSEPPSPAQLSALGSAAKHAPEDDDLLASPLKAYVAPLAPGASTPPRPLQQATASPAPLTRLQRGAGFSTPTRGAAEQAEQAEQLQYVGGAELSARSDVLASQSALDRLHMAREAAGLEAALAAVPAELRIAAHEIRRLEHAPLLGTGAYGCVYRAEWQGAVVAVKELDGPPSDATALAEFSAELAAWAQLRHPHVVPLYGACVGERLRLVCKLMPHGALSDHLHAPGAPALPFATLLRLARQVASGLRHAHARGVVHRDIKSFNVLLDEEGQAHLGDFGLSVRFDPQAPERVQASAAHSRRGSERKQRSVQASPARPPRVPHSLAAPPSPFSPHQVNVTPTRAARRTPSHAHAALLPPYAAVVRTPQKHELPTGGKRAAASPSFAAADSAQGALECEPYAHSGVALPNETGGPLGTFGYCAPEIFTSGLYSPASDVFAFGAMLLEFATRAVPFGATPPLDIARAVVAGHRPPLPDDLPPPYAALIRHCCAQAPEDRPSCDELHARLAEMEAEAAEEERALQAHRDRREQHERSRRDRERSAWLGAERGPASFDSRAHFDATSAHDSAGHSATDADEQLELVQLSAADLECLTRSERAYYNRQLRKHHRAQLQDARRTDDAPQLDDGDAEADAAMRGGAEHSRMQAELFEDEPDAVRDADEHVHWKRVHAAEQLATASQPRGIRGHTRALSSPTASPVRCRARSKQSRALLKKIAALLEDAEADGSSDTEATAGQSTTAVAAAQDALRNVTPVLPFTLVPGELPVAPPSEDIEHSTQQPIALLTPVAWADPSPRAAALQAAAAPSAAFPQLAVPASSAVVCSTPVRAENLLLTHANAAIPPASAQLHTPSAVLFHAAPSRTPSAVAACESAPKREQRALFASPALARSPSSTSLAPASAASSRAAQGESAASTPEEAAPVSRVQGSAPLSLPIARPLFSPARGAAPDATLQPPAGHQRVLLPSLGAVPALHAADAALRPVLPPRPVPAARASIGALASDDRKEAEREGSELPRIRPLRAGAAAVLPVSEELAIVPAPPAAEMEPPAVKACCSIM